MAIIMVIIKGVFYTVNSIQCVNIVFNIIILAYKIYYGDFIYICCYLNSIKNLKKSLVFI